MVDLTDRQRAVLAYVHREISRNGWAPSIKEMCAHFRWASTHTAFIHLETLKRKGAIERLKGASRAIRITPAGRGSL